MYPNPSTNYRFENIRTTGRTSIAAEPFRDPEKILSVFLLLVINPTVSHSTNASFIPSPEGSASSTLSFHTSSTFHDCEHSHERDLRSLFPTGNEEPLMLSVEVRHSDWEPSTACTGSVTCRNYLFFQVDSLSVKCRG